MITISLKLYRISLQYINTATYIFKDIETTVLVTVSRLLFIIPTSLLSWTQHSAVIKQLYSFH